MRFISQFPLFGFLLIIYNIISGTMFYSNPNDFYIDHIVLSLHLPSNVDFKVTYIELWIIASLCVLVIESIRRTTQTYTTILKHTFSVIIFFLYTIEFVLVPFATNPAFFIMLLLSGIDIIVGSVIVISAARQDIVIGESDYTKEKNKHSVPDHSD